MLAISHHPLIGTVIGGGIALVLVGAFLLVLCRMSKRALDATNGINRNRKDHDSDV